jgi:hypothetical protein
MPSSCWERRDGTNTGRRSNSNFKYAGKPFSCFRGTNQENCQTIFEKTLKNDADLFHDSWALNLWINMMGEGPRFDQNAEFSQNSSFQVLRPSPNA